MPKPVIGDFCKLYRNTGTDAQPVYVEWGDVEGCTSDLSRTLVPVNARALAAVPTIAGKIATPGISFTFIPGINATNFSYLTDNFFDDECPAPSLWLMADGDVARDGQGLSLPCNLESISESQNSGATRSMNVSLKYAYMVEGNAVLLPKWVS